MRFPIVSIRTILLSLAIATINGCATAPDAGRMQPLGLLPNIDCSGKLAGTVTGNLSGTLGVGGATTGTFQVDCGQHFRLLHPKSK